MVCEWAEPNGSDAKEKIVVIQPGNKGEACNFMSPTEAWSLQFADSFTSHKWKNFQENSYIQAEIVAWCQDNSAWTKSIHWSVVFGRSIESWTHEHERALSEIFGLPVFKATMSVTCFEFLTLCIRFNDKTSRPEQKRNDKSAASRDIWEMFIAYCKMFYTPSVQYTVDEHLPGFCGCCFLYSEEAQ